MHKLLLAALVALAPISGAPAQDEVTAPVDTIARAKFAGVDGELVDAIAYINRIVNEGIEPVSDQEHYGKGEMWVMFPADNKGDCEDYALTKLGILAKNGFPAVAYSKIRGVIVRDGKVEEGHAILELRMPNGAVMVLDNRFDEPMTRAELMARGYTFFEW